MAIHSGVAFSLIAGICAALASVFGKLAVNPSIVYMPFVHVLSFLMQQGIGILLILSTNTTTVANCTIWLSAIGQYSSFFLTLQADIKLYNESVVMIEQVIRVLCIGMVVLSNVVMVNMFAKAMDLAGSVNATVMNTAANFFFSAIFGNLFFGEVLSLMWFVGASIIMCGLALMHKGADLEKSKQSNQKSQQPKPKPRKQKNK